MTTAVAFATLAATLAAATAAPHARYERIAHSYFNTWNAHDEAALRALFTDDVSLRDWDISKSGSSAVVKTNANIWKAVPNVRIEVLVIHASDHTSSAVCEILVHLGDTASTVLKVVDVLTIDVAASKISSVRAYKG